MLVKKLDLKRSLLFLVLIGSWFVIWSGAVSAQVISQPFRIGGAVTIDGVAVTQASGGGLAIKVIKPDGSKYTDVNGNSPEDNDGLNASDWYMIDIPIYSPEQSGGANTGDAARIQVFLKAQKWLSSRPPEVR